LWPERRAARAKFSPRPEEPPVMRKLKGRDMMKERRLGLQVETEREGNTNRNLWRCGIDDTDASCAS
jgi:hypothetical protein